MQTGMPCYGTVRRLWTLIAGFLVLHAPVAALGWGAPGHQAVGAIADRYIAGSNAAQQVDAILGGMSLQTAAVWADCAKGVSKEKQTGAFKYTIIPTYKECRPFEDAAGQQAMVDFVKSNWDACKPLPGDEVCHKQYHYADVALERNAYKRGLVGTSDQDVVSAINAAIIVLQGGPAPAPFTFANKKEALTVLAHYAGDIHQPLHVVAIYLDPEGNVVDPDSGTYDPATKTDGGNKIEDGSIALHKEWDTIPASMDAAHLSAARMAAVRKVPVSASPVSEWAAEWATDTIATGKAAFKGLKFGKEDSKHQWQVRLPPNYSTSKTAIQCEQLIKAGAHLGQLLQAIWP